MRWLIKEIKRISKLVSIFKGNKHTKGYEWIGLAILSTKRSDDRCDTRKNNVGGEIICRVF